MPGSVNAIIMWEDNPDTTINATNLSKSIDINAQSKFIEYTESESDKEEWADYVFDFYSDDSAGLTYVDKIVYFKDIRQYAKGSKNQDGTYIWLLAGFPIPDYKMLKIHANTKISMKYIDTSNQQQYMDFDVGMKDSVFSIESLLLDDDFQPNVKYVIYMYHTSISEDSSVLKILTEYDDENNTDDWKNGPSDPGSPTGTKVVAIRKIGGFKTNNSGYIDVTSLWDLTTYSSEIITKKYKKMDVDGVRDLNAADIPLIDESNNFISNNVEDALSDIKINVDQFYTDMYYTSDRFGVELEYSIFTKDGSSMVPIDFSSSSLTIPLTIPLRITPGYINISGRRINVENPIYLGELALQMRVNQYYGLINNITLGSAPSSPHSTEEPCTTIYPGIWRVFINSDGVIILREGDQYLPRFLVDEIRKGWYYTDSSRCIGKFRVRAEATGIYLEKMSVTNTFDIPIPKNTVHTIHGTMCPDGLFPCDGNWHDTSGYTAASYFNMPSPTGTQWSLSWWDQTPNMYGKSAKMFDQSDFDVATGTIQRSVPQPAFKWELDQNQEYAIIQSGGSDDCGQEGGEDTHIHIMTHKHSPTSGDGDLRITSSQNDPHGHNPDVVIIDQTNDKIEVVRFTDGSTQTPVLVPTETHIHSGQILASGGNHGHSNESISGLVGNANPDETQLSSNWAPYKEFIMCIKK